MFFLYIIVVTISCDDGYIIMNDKCLKLRSIGEKCNSSNDYCEDIFSSCFKICSCLEDFVSENKICVPIQKSQETIIKYETYIDLNIVILTMSCIIIIIIIIISITKIKAYRNEDNPIDIEHAFYNNIMPGHL